ncbi:glycosyltransferase family 92 protein [Caldibacillus lycopersici]|uniref:Glycosyltransferase family 92 protein n=1 Tax=Perspicuibacillus lycopersici TaxID=1325689 RepID=A0AAE3ITJ4_9BACI|nr:glycosyltransferase family 92 protein [Perspicuibacillus lycopersici]MCU9613189.1 glycosyltransferase family 92 protein [Perspicuibacillus lycopersici]
MIKENRYLIFDRPINEFRYLIKKTASLVMTPYYKLLLNFIHPRNKKEKKFYVSICAIFRDEGKYLKEWIEFHKIVGIDHFYLYNNFSEDEYEEILTPYINNGEVTLIDWPIPQGQMEAYKDCVERFGSETQWIAFIDLDEYIIPNKMDTVREFLMPFEKNRPVVIVYWKYMGSSGIINRDVNGLITEDFIIGWKKYANIGKYFFNTSYEYDQNYKKNQYMHLMWGKHRRTMLPPVNCFNKECLYGIHPVPNEDMPIQINHYVVKSYNEYVEKKSKRGGGVHAEGFHTLDYFWYHDMKCQRVDYHAYKYLIKLKGKINHHE